MVFDNFLVRFPQYDSFPKNLKYEFVIEKVIIIFSQLTTLAQSNAVLSKNNVELKLGSNSHFSVYFLKGNDPNSLTVNQQKEISDFVAKDSLSSSILIYNPAESARRIANWKASLPWIQPHYAIKSCPSMDLIKDLAK